MFCDKNLITILRRKHPTGVKAHAESGHMGTEFHCRGDEFLASVLMAEGRIGDVPSMAIREAEV
jgi:hypothetical protein